jgi:DNA-binding MarR family transcriptional regulator
VTEIRKSQAEPVRLPRADTEAPQGLELRHLRYFVAVADAGTFTHAAERLFIAQPTLSQQIQRLEQMVGTPLLHRRRDGVRLTAPGTVLLEAARDELSAVDHAASQTRQAAGMGRRPRVGPVTSSMTRNRVPSPLGSSTVPASNTVTRPGWRSAARVRISASTRRRSSPAAVSNRNT